MVIMAVGGSLFLSCLSAAVAAVMAAAIWAASAVAAVVAVAAPAAVITAAETTAAAAVAAIRPAAAAIKQKESLFRKRKGLFSCIFSIEKSTLSMKRKYRPWEGFHERLREKNHGKCPHGAGSGASARRKPGIIIVQLRFCVFDSRPIFLTLSSFFFPINLFFFFLT